MEAQETPIIIDYLEVLGRNMTTIGKAIRNAMKKEIGEDTVKGDSIKIAILGITKEGSNKLLTLPIKIPTEDFKGMTESKTKPKKEEIDQIETSSGASEILSDQELAKIKKLKAAYNDPETSPETKEMVKNRLIELGALI